jgi:hypothetical protein
MYDRMKVASAEQIHAITIIKAVDDRYLREVRKAKAEAKARKTTALCDLKMLLPHVTERGANGGFVGNEAEEALIGMNAQEYLNEKRMRVDYRFDYIGAVEFAIKNPNARASDIYKRFQPKGIKFAGY